VSTQQELMQQVLMQQVPVPAVRRALMVLVLAMALRPAKALLPAKELLRPVPPPEPASRLCSHCRRLC
jgi:hypothetical protein